MKQVDDETTFEKIKRKPSPSRPNVNHLVNCGRKHSYNKKTALHMAAALAKRGIAKKPLRAYRCKTGNHWHLTSMPRPIFRKHHERRG